MRLKGDLILLALRAAHYADAPQPRADSPEFANLEFQAEELANAIELLVESKIRAALADVQVIGDRLWDGS